MKMVSTNTKKACFSCLLFLIAFLSKSQVQLVINEVSQGYAGSQEYVELLVVGTPTCNGIPTYDIRHYYIDDNNGTFATGAGTGIADGCVRLSNDALWSNVPAGTLILIYNDAVGNVNTDINPANDDFSTTDGNCKLQIPISNCTYFEKSTTQPNVGSATYTGTLTTCGIWTSISMANSDDSFHTLDATGNVIHAVSWGNNTNNNIIYFATSQTGKVCAMQNSINNVISNQSNWTSVAVSSTAQTPGAPNNAANAAWINSMNNGCSALTALSTPVTSINAGCSCSGSAAVTPSGAIGPYTYSWAPSGGTSSTASGLCAGNYTVTVTSSNGCVNTPTVAINAASTLTASISSTSVACNGTSTGSASVSVSGGSGSYSYTWSPSGGNGASASGLSASTYTVNYNDGAGCTGSKTVTVTQPASALTATANATSNVNCNGGSSGSATVAASGGTSSYTYSWAPSGGTGTSASGLSAGNYTVTVTDANNCATAKTVTVTQPTPLTVTLSSTNVNCNGSGTGSATVAASGGTGAYSYSWSPGGGTSTSASGLVAGNYTITVTDANSCAATKTVAITQPASALSATVSASSVNCNGASTGSATVSATGGTAGYTYTWSPGGGNATTASGLAAGNYTVNVTDSKGCTASNSVTITQPGSPLTSTANVTANVNCNGASTGSATVAASGGTSGYTYTWLPSGGNSTNASGLVAGNYTVNVTDSKGCTTSNSISITQPTAAISATSSLTNLTCNGDNSGAATVTPSGGTGAYTYSWTPAGGTNSTASGLAAGNYTVIIRDANNCPFNYALGITQPPPLTATVSASNILCNGASTGSATITASGGTGPFTYTWAPSGSGANSSGLPAGTYTIVTNDNNKCALTKTVSISQPSAITATVNNTQATCGSSNGTATVVASGGTGVLNYSWSPVGGTGMAASGLAAGNYTVTIADANGCVKTANTTISNSGGPSASITSTSVSCNGNSTATASVSALGGTGPYSYTWSPSGGNASSASGLTGGINYTVTIADANNCVGTATTSIAQPALPLTSTVTTTNINCNGSSTGSATLAASGGTSGYTYTWTPSGGNSTTANGLPAGNYTVNITDSKGCTASNSVSITQPSSPLSSTISVITNVNCFGGSTGSASVAVAGGTAGYTYTWSPGGGNTTASSSLTAGNYTLSITDSQGCTTNNTFTISQPASALTSTANVTANVNCFGGTTGAASVSVAGGTPGYSYTWSPGGGNTNTAAGLAAGNYTVNITDNNGCTTNNTFTVTQPSAVLTATISPVSILCNGGTASATINASGGTGPYTYSWSPTGGSSATMTLTAGNYSVTTTDSHSCVTTNTLALSQPTAISLTVSSTQATCGNSNGSASVNVSGGTAGYTYTWSPLGGNTNTASNIAAGNYTIHIVDANGCKDSSIVMVTNPGGPTASVTSTSVACNGATNGSATVTLTGGSGPFSYTWSPAGGNNAVASNLPAGNYAVTVSDINLCISSATVSVVQPTAITTNTVAANVLCNATSTGSATVIANGGTGAYTYAWLPFGGNNNTATSLNAGNYSVTVTDANGCTNQNTIIITEPSPITATLTVTSVSCGSGNNGSVSVTANGGIAPFSYTWYPTGGNTSTASSLAPGTYSVVINDNNGCMKDTFATVSGGSNPPLPGANSYTYCSGSNITALTVTGSGGTLNWYSDPGLTNLVASGNSYLPSPTPAVTTIYYITETSTAGCVSNVATDTLIIRPLPTLTVSGTANYCTGDNINPITVNTTGGIVSWYSDAGLTNQVGSGTTFIPVPSPTTTSVYYVHAVSYTNCVSLVSTDTIKIYPKPVISGGITDTAKCGMINGGVKGIQVNGGAIQYSYQWTDVSTGNIVGTSDSLRNVGAGTYSLLVTDAHGCTATSTSNFTVIATNSVSASFTASTLSGETPLPVTFTNTSVGATNYIWTFGDTSLVNTATNPTYTYNTSGTFTVTLISSNGFCSDTAYAVLKVDENTVIIIPNIFSPNGDQVNDEFFITSKGLKDLKCIIFNRWGQEVYSLNAPDQVWDGIMNNGNHATEGTYYYMIEANSYSGKNFKQQGPLTLVR